MAMGGIPRGRGRRPQEFLDLDVDPSIGDPGEN